LTITTTAGGTTNPAPRTYTYTANSTVQVAAIPAEGNLFDHWELDYINVGSANPNMVLINENHMLRALFSSAPVGGYSITTEASTATKPLTAYRGLVLILLASFTIIRRKTLRKNQLIIANNTSFDPSS